MFYQFIIFFIIVILIMYLVRFIVRNKLNIPLDWGNNRPINHIHRWGNRIFIGLALSILILIYWTDNFNLLYLVFALLLVYVCFEAFLEWKYEPEEKQYFLSIIEAIAVGVIFIGFIILSLKTLTFEEALEETGYIDLDSNQYIEIEDVSFHPNEEDMSKQITIKQKASIEDPNLINQIFDEFSELEYREKSLHDDSRGHYYRLYLKTNNYSYSDITVYDEYISIFSNDYNTYQIIGENGIYQFLEEEEAIDWEIPESND
ncbi:DUF4181 domain-containing protein [Ornithinibacillus sp. 179-J 7C1 HS]|uniref:DUF4181 domain-containing protein n=1 Tax=Ornithinibacillus sp. 179-J 7C1 HS TaxID=3142384 RepID=UPI00399F7D8F